MALFRHLPLVACFIGAVAVADASSPCTTVAPANPCAPVKTVTTTPAAAPCRVVKKDIKAEIWAPIVAVAGAGAIAGAVVGGINAEKPPPTTVPPTTTPAPTPAPTTTMSKRKRKYKYKSKYSGKYGKGSKYGKYSKYGRGRRPSKVGPPNVTARELEMPLLSARVATSDTKGTTAAAVLNDQSSSGADLSGSSSFASLPSGKSSSLDSGSGAAWIWALLLFVLLLAVLGLIRALLSRGKGKKKKGSRELNNYVAPEPVAQTVVEEVSPLLMPASVAAPVPPMPYVTPPYLYPAPSPALYNYAPTSYPSGAPDVL